MRNRSAVTRFYRVMAILFGGALYLMLTKQVDAAAYFILALGAIAVATAGISIRRKGNTDQV